jgi:ribonuclease VapC
LILDSSAIVAVVRREQGHPPVLAALEAAGSIGIGTPTLVETSVVLIRKMGVPGRLALASFIEENEVVSIPFGEDHWKAAADAFIRYGKGRHPAGLNYGDCMTYATAQVADRPLLFTGGDFARTDLASALD